MSAMTPIKQMLIVGQTVYAVDHSGQLNPIAQCASEPEAMLAGVTLAVYHKKSDSIFALDTKAMQIVKVDVDEEAEQENPFGPKED